MPNTTTARLLPNPNMERRRDEFRAFTQTCGGVILCAAALLLATSLLIDPAIVCEHCFWMPVGFGAAAGVGLTIAGVGERRVPAHPRPVPPAARQTRPPDVKPVPRIGEILVSEMGSVCAQEFNLALSHRRRHGGPIGQVLVDMGLITSAQLLEALETQDRHRRRHGVEPWQEGIRLCR